MPPYSPGSARPLTVHAGDPVDVSVPVMDATGANTLVTGVVSA